jgi:histidyl-tRNA synthetase
VGCPNCRPAFIEILREKLRDVAPRMCADCQRRAVTNPLRVLDCKVPEDQPIIDTLPSILDHLDPVCRDHFAQVKTYLDDRAIKYEVRPRLVRGLDYYRRTTFEIVHGSLGAQNSVLGGGRYDGLAEALGSKVPAPGVGFSIGEDRLVMSVEAANPTPETLDVFIAPLGMEAFRHCSRLAMELRRNGVVVEVATDAKLKRALETANKIGAHWAVIVGDNEIAAGAYVLKNMQSGEQTTVSQDQLFRTVGKIALE